MGCVLERVCRCAERACTGIEGERRVFWCCHSVVGDVSDGGDIDGDGFDNCGLGAVGRQHTCIFAIVNDRNGEFVGTRCARSRAVIVGNVEVGQTIHGRVHLSHRAGEHHRACAIAGEPGKACDRTKRESAMGDRQRHRLQSCGARVDIADRDGVAVGG